LPEDSIWNKAKKFLTDLVSSGPSSPVMRVTRRDAELELLKKLPSAPQFPNFEPGVLLSDRIEYLATHYKLIDPFRQDKLKPAAYELSVGDLYSMGGETHRLLEEPGRNELVIKPFEVVIIQTLERLNLPEYLIARWNVRVTWAYEGLLWVGAAQVYPGFKGFLACPLYNLSNKPVRLTRGEGIAVIDFVTTTDPKTQPSGQKYNPYKRDRVLFEDYGPNRLRSALATETQQKVQEFDTQLKDLDSRVDSFAAVISIAIGILVTALALFVGNQIPEELKRLSPALMVSAVALCLSLAAYLFAGYRHFAAWKRGRIYFAVILALFVIILAAILVLELKHADSPFQARPTSSSTPPANPAPAPTNPPTLGGKLSLPRRNRQPLRGQALNSLYYSRLQFRSLDSCDI
jgi:deoxycytidine triphosphate deaminase